MGGFAVPQLQQDEQGNPIYGYPWSSPTASPYAGGTNAQMSTLGFNVGGPYADVDPNASMEDIFASNRNIINTTGNQIGLEGRSELGYYGPLQQKYQGAQDAALDSLGRTPGFTAEEAAGVQGDPNAPVRALTQNQENGTGAMLNQYQKDAGTALSGYKTGLESATGGFQSGVLGSADRYRSGVSGAATELGEGLAGAQSKFGALDTAVGDPALGFDPGGTEKQLTDRDVSDLTTQAGTTVGNQYQANLDTLNRQAAAQGNTSPAALEAMRQSLMLQEGSQAGDAMTNARIAALQAQYGRAAGIESQRLGATQTQAGLRATAATTEEAAAQAAAGQAGQANISAQENIGATDLAAREAAGAAGMSSATTLGNAALNTENQYGQFSTQTANQMAGQQLNAQQLAEQEASARAGTVAGARISGENAYRSGVAQQQGMAQQGGQTAVQQQLGAYGTQTAGLNQNASGQAGFEVGKPSFGDSLGKGAAAAVGNLFEHGGIVTEPTIAKIGERGPEAVIPISRYRSPMRSQREPGDMREAA